MKFAEKQYCSSWDSLSNTNLTSRPRIQLREKFWQVKQAKGIY